MCTFEIAVQKHATVMMYVIIRSANDRNTIHCMINAIMPIKRNAIPLDMYFANR